ncbi:hypothetical protein ACH5RR_010055 [Cinchona calisaya]|uniref:Homeobox domain-containing protein n=1 Tax=Cinchona calisaya TaxID=153742 RepID=A0ABD3AIJ7_9GENT
MENHESISGGAAAGGASRWNPTKEQIDMLESLYKQGLRTPSAEQIQQITNRLRAFGHIEGKNVFYWFQNHKARQRQKQKQDHASVFNRFLHKTSFVPPCPNNVICSPFYMPYPEMGLTHQQQPKVLLPRNFKRRPTLPEKLEKSKLCGSRALYDQANREYISTLINPCGKANQETLDLFPLHPTGNLQSRSTEAEIALANSTSNIIPSTSSAFKTIGNDQGEGASNGHPFFDFFCGNSSCNGH